MQLIVNKAKLPKGQSYVLKTSQLQEALEALDLDINVHLNYYASRTRHTGRNIFECRYWLPKATMPYKRFYIGIGTVNRDEKELAANLIISTVIDQFMAWVKFIDALPVNSTLAKHDSYFSVMFKAGAITIASDVVIT